MFLGILVLITALSISAVAIYYSVAGLVAIFAAAAVPIMIMGGALEIGKLVTAVWLHRYWHEAAWWLKTYLSIAVLVLMFITSMGIFGFLSKAHIEQTANAQEGIAQLERIDIEISRQEAVIARAEQRIIDAELSIGEGNAAIQEQIDREQDRINSAYSRIQPAIDEQNAIIESARQANIKRTEPFEQQLAALDEELRRLDVQAQQHEQRIADLNIDVSAIEPILAQIATIEESISLVQGQLAGGERSAIQSAQRTIGVEDDGSAGSNTRRAADAWIATQQERISQLQSQITEVRLSAQQTTDIERTRLTTLVASIRGEQTTAIKNRQSEILETIDNVRSTESPAVQTARNEIARIRAGADAQISQSNALIQNLRESLTVGKDLTVEETIAEQQQKIVEANNTVDTLTEQKYTLEAEYRKLEAEVGPVKYLAEFVYGEAADTILLEEAVRWVIIIIIFVFDPLAVLLLIASQATFELRRDANQKLKEEKAVLQQKRWQEYEQTRAQAIVNNPGWQAEEKNNVNTNGSNDVGDIKEQRSETQRNSERTNSDSGNSRPENNNYETTMYRLPGIGNEGRDLAEGMDRDEIEDNIKKEQQRRIEYEEKEKNIDIQNSKTAWKQDHPDETLKHYKNLYIKGMIDSLPWEDYKSKDNYNVEEGYTQNSEQDEKTLFNKIQRKNSDEN